MKTEKVMSLKTLGKYVRTKRKEKKMTQEELAVKVERDTAYIGRLERGVQVGSIVSVVKVAIALGERPGYLVDLLYDTLPENGTHEILPATTERVVEISDDLIDEDIDFILQTVEMVTERRKFILDKASNSSGKMEPTYQQLRDKYRGIQRFLPTKKQMEEFEKAKLTNGNQINQDKNKVPEVSQ